MICQTCQATVDNDLIFCTECGSRLTQNWGNAQSEATVVLNNPPTQTQPVKKSSPLKWILAIVGLLGIAGVFGIGLLIFLNPFSKPAKPSKHDEINVNRSADHDSSDSESNKKSDDEETTVIDERVNVDKNSHIAFPFKVTDDYVEFAGEIENLGSEKFEGYVFMKDLYDEKTVDPLYKMFSLNTSSGKISKTEQFLFKGDYVLVFKDTSGKGGSLKATFSVKPQKL
jgi:uncharacterized membrane protein YvbJ